MRIMLVWVALMLAGCKTVPENVNEGELVVSEGVKKLFAESGVDAKEAGERIRCERHRIVGTHLIKRVCMTWEEWEAIRKNAQFQVRRDRIRNQACDDCGNN